MENIGTFIFSIFDRILSLKDALMDFLFKNISFLGLEISMWQMFAGVGLSIFLVAAIVKCFL